MLVQGGSPGEKELMAHKADLGTRAWCRCGISASSDIGNASRGAVPLVRDQGTSLVCPAKTGRSQISAGASPPWSVQYLLSS